MKAERWAAWMWYRGDRFHGFQSQGQGEAVQDAVARALTELGARAVALPSGRTDRGVHARMQVVGVRLPPGAQLERFAHALSAQAPGAIGLCALRRTHPRFHPQWSASQKEYRYRLALGAAAPAEWAPFAWRPREHPRIGRDPDPSALAGAIQRLRGERDFIAFHGKSSPRRPRRLDASSLREIHPGVFELRFLGSGFGRHQVRFLAAACALVGSGAVEAAALEESLETGAPFPGLMAPASALVLWDVRYPPDLDPFSAEERALSPGVPAEPPFTTG